MSLDSLSLGSLRSIIIVKPSSLGDVVHTLPVLALLRKHAPQAKIEWIVNSVWAPLLRNHLLLDGLIEFPRQQFHGVSGAFGLLRWAREQGNRRPDLALDVQGLLRSAVIARGCRPRLLVGYSDAREGAGFLHHAHVDVSAKRSPHAVDRYLTFFSQLGLELPENIEFPLSEGEPPEVAANLPDRFILLHPFSRGQGKSLTATQVEELARRWEGLPVLLVGKADVPDLNLPDSCIDLLNRTSLGELIWLLRRATWTVSVDSGPMHLAAAASPNLLSLHTWSDPLKVGPYCEHAHVWKAGSIRTMAEYRAAPEPETAGGKDGFPDEAIASVADFVRSAFTG